MEIKKPRPTTVCSFCRRRKIKCNKQQPCSSCLRYNSQKCEYENLPPRSTNSASDSSSGGHDVQTSMLLHIRSLAPSSLYSFDLRDHPHRAPQGPPINHGDPSYTRHAEIFLTFSQPTSKSAPTFDGPSHPDYGCYGDNVSPRQQLPKLSRLLKDYSFEGDPGEDSDSELNFLDTYDPCFNDVPLGARYVGPLSWNAMIRLDPTLNRMWVEVHKERCGEHLPTAANNKLYSADNSIRLACTYADAPPSSGSIIFAMAATPSFDLTTPTENPSIKPNNSTGDVNEDLVSRIQQLLPKQKVLWGLVDRFFKHLYPFMPILDQKILIANWTRILGAKEYVYRPIENLDLRTKTDFAEMGILLIVLRLSYLTYFSTNQLVNERNRRKPANDLESSYFHYMLANPVFPDTYNVAVSCLNQFDFIGDSDMSILQLATFIRLYQLYGPEYCDGAELSDSHVFNSLLIQMGYLFGLHREPRNQAELMDERTIHLRRKIWYKTQLMCLAYVYQSGNCLPYYGSSSDVKMPFLTDSNCSHESELIEAAGLRILENNLKATRIVNEVVFNICDVKNGFTMKEARLQLEECFNQIIDMTHDVGIPAWGSKRRLPKLYSAVHIVHSLGRLTYIMLSVYFNSFNYYLRSDNYNKAMKNVNELLRLICHQVIPPLGNVRPGCGTSQRNMIGILKAPILQSLIHRSGLIILSLIMRVKIVLESMDSLDQKASNMLHASLVHFELSLRKAMSVLLEYVQRMLDRYRYARTIVCTFEQFQHWVDTVDVATLDGFPGCKNEFGFTNHHLLGFNWLVDAALSQHEAANAHCDEDDSKLGHNDPLLVRVLQLRDVPRPQRYKTFFAQPNYSALEAPVQDDDLYWSTINTLLQDKMS